MKEYKKVLEETIKEWGKPVASYKLTYDSPQNQIEPIYYWILDFLQDARWKVKKITDNFTASPGSGQFVEMNQRVTRMQEEGMKMLGGINQIIKSVLNLIYDLKEFEIRLSHYKDAQSEDKTKRYEGLLALKQIWLDNVDIKRQRGSIHMMANELGFTTLREAFMMANSQEDIKKLNDDKSGALINDQVMRILQPRLNEFFIWQKLSQKELEKRMNIEKNYLRSQVETLKLYSTWMKPYLKAAEELKQQGFEGNAALVHAFSTTMFELTLLGKKEIKEIPEKFRDKNQLKAEYNLKRKYYQVVLINLKYRGHLAQRVGPKGDFGFGVGGRIDMAFDAYALNEEEIGLVEKKMAEEDVGEMYQFSHDVAAEALNELKEDLEYFLKSEEEKKKEDEKKQKKEKSEDINPFTALWDLFFGWIGKKREEKKEKKDITKSEDISSDNFIEKTVRAEAAKDAAEGIYTIYDIYKKAHGHASSPESFDNATGKTKEPTVKFSDVFKG